MCATENKQKIKPKSTIRRPEMKEPKAVPEGENTLKQKKRSEVIAPLGF